MAEVKTIRLNKVLREFNISLDRAVEFLSSKGHEIEARPTTKISDNEYQILFEGFQTDKSKKVASKEVGEEKRKEKEELRLEREKEIEEKQKREASRVIRAEVKLDGPKKLGKIDLNPVKPKVKKEEVAEKVKEEVAEEVKEEVVEEVKEVPVLKKTTATKKEPVKKEVKEEVKKEEKPVTIPVVKKETAIDKTQAKAKEKEPAKEKKKPENEVEVPVVSEKVETKYTKLNGPNFTGKKIDLTQFKKPEKKKVVSKVTKKVDLNKEKRSKRRRISKSPPVGGVKSSQNNRGPARTNVPKEEPSEAEVQKQVRETLEKLQGKGSKKKGAKYRREKRDIHRQKTEEEKEQEQEKDKEQKTKNKKNKTKKKKKK